MNVSNTSKLLEPYSRPFVRNIWYCAGWADELTGDLVPRRILNEPVVFYRTEEGEAVAMLDICPHKLAPLSLGARVGNNIRCGYHGLEFDSNGACVHNPQGNGIIPKNAGLRSYPLEERHGVLWIWMGERDRADPDLIPDFSHILDPAQQTVKGGHRVECNYMMMVENLMDLGHALFLHSQTAGISPVNLAGNDIGQGEGWIYDRRHYENVPCPSAFARYFEKDERVDFWNDIKWHPPSLILNYTGASKLGDARGESAFAMFGSHFLTPETQHTTHYWYSHTRNHAQQDESVDEYFRNWQRTALKAEDSMVAEAIDQRVAEAENLGVDMCVLSTDVSGIKVNQALDRLVEAERIRRVA